MERPIADLTGLGASLPHVPLGTLPTPVERADGLAAELGVDELWVKRDDRTGEEYGGNKVRKLEFILGDAVERGIDHVWTGGTIGSNHVLATAIYAREQSLVPHAVQAPQPVTEHVRTNLRALATTRPDLRLVRNELHGLLAAAKLRLKRRLASRPAFYYVPLGGCSPVGELGYVNAALELREQIAAGRLPEPDVIVVPVGTGGTAAGLALGCSIAGIDATVAGVRVTNRVFGNRWRIGRLARKTRAALRGYGATDVPPASRTTVEIVTGFTGEGYGVESPQAERAKAVAARHGLGLDGTYTAKTVGAMLAGAGPQSEESVVLYWHTYNGIDLSDRVAAADVHRDLPRPYHRFFPEDERRP